MLPALLSIVLVAGPCWAGQRTPQSPEAAARKFARVERFSTRLPALRAWVDSGLTSPRPDRQTALAAIIRIMDSLFIRVGSSRYANPKASNRTPSYGASSLLKQHVSVEGDLIRFEFRGKAGVSWKRELHDPQLAGAVRVFLQTPGERLFEHVTERHVEAALAAYEAKPKDFRTLHANRLLGLELGKLSPPVTAAQAQKNLGSAIRNVAKQLGHTPAVCRSAYLNPATLSAYGSGLSH